MFVAIQDVIHGYARAIELVPINKDKEEKSLEPLVKLVSYLAKALYRDQIQVRLGVCRIVKIKANGTTAPRCINVYKNSCTNSSC